MWCSILKDSFSQLLQHLTSESASAISSVESHLNTLLHRPTEMEISSLEDFASWKADSAQYTKLSKARQDGLFRLEVRAAEIFFFLILYSSTGNTDNSETSIGFSLSSVALSKSEVFVLYKGISFFPSPK